MSAASWEEELRRVLREHWSLTSEELDATISLLERYARKIVVTAAEAVTLYQSPARAVDVPKNQYHPSTMVHVTPTLAIEALTLGLDMILCPEASAFVRATALEALRK